MTSKTKQYLAKLAQTAEYSELVRRYIATCERYAELEAVIDAEGFTVISTKGTTMIHPVMRELRNLQDDLLKMEKELLLTPKAKGSTEPDTKATALEEFLSAN